MNGRNCWFKTQEQFPGIANLHIFNGAEYVENKHKTPGVQLATGS